MGYETTNNLSMAEYHRTRGLSSSALAYADESMAKYRAYLNGDIRLESKSLDLGNAVHLILESTESFYDSYQLRPDGIDRRTKAGKEAFAELESNGKIVLDSEQWNTIHRLYRNYMDSSDDLIQMVINSEGYNESSLFWNEQGIVNKCRPDRLIYPNESDSDILCNRFPELFDVPFGISICVDFKTTSKPIDPKSFYWTAVNFKYFIKASHYIAGTNADAFLFVVFETNPPYGIGRYFVSKNRMLEMAARRSELLTQIAECEQSGFYPGISVSDSDTLL